MICLTKAQRRALFRLFQRDFPAWVTPFRQNSITRENRVTHARGLPFRFRRFGAHCGSDRTKPCDRVSAMFPILALGQCSPIVDLAHLRSPTMTRY